MVVATSAYRSGTLKSPGSRLASPANWPSRMPESQEYDRCVTGCVRARAKLVRVPLSMVPWSTAYPTSQYELCLFDGESLLMGHQRCCGFYRFRWYLAPWNHSSVLKQLGGGKIAGPPLHPVRPCRCQYRKYSITLPTRWSQWSLIARLSPLSDG